MDNHLDKNFLKGMNRTLDSPFLLRQGEPCTSHYIHYVFVHITCTIVIEGKGIQWNIFPISADYWLGRYQFLPGGGGASVCDGRSPIFSGPPLCRRTKKFGHPLCLRGKIMYLRRSRAEGAKIFWRKIFGPPPLLSSKAAPPFGPLK